jgi:hypothetical protein
VPDYKNLNGQKMILLYITLGNQTALHGQAAFSIYSFIAKGNGLFTINIITDSPNYYAHLDDQIIVRPISNEILNEWKGRYDFFWRIKIKAIEWMCREYPGRPVIYLDTDTFFYGDVSELQSILKNGNAIMHEDEGPLSAMPEKTAKKMWGQIKGALFGGLKMIQEEKMWNAGVAGCPNTKQLLECDLALKICDEMCAAGVTPRLIEQFALSVALNHIYKIKSVDSLIGHYWSNKEEWNDTIASFFLKTYFEKKTTEEIINSMSLFNFSALPVKKIESNTARRLNKKIGKLFKTKSIGYIDTKDQNAKES